MKKLTTWGVAACMAAVFASACISGCSPEAPSGEGKGSSDKAAVVTIDWSMQSDCSACHSDQGASQTNSACLASVHAESKTACTTCHGDEGALSAVHENATASEKMPRKLKKTEVGDEVCESCHGSYSDLAAATPDVVLTDVEGTAVNPHAAKGLNTDHEDGFSCGSCHVEHEESNVLEAADITCSNCHHRGVYKCGTCHE